MPVEVCQGGQGYHWWPLNNIYQQYTMIYLCLRERHMGFWCNIWGTQLLHTGGIQNQSRFCCVWNPLLIIKSTTSQRGAHGFCLFHQPIGNLHQFDVFFWKQALWTAGFDIICSHSRSDAPRRLHDLHKKGTVRMWGFSFAFKTGCNNLAIHIWVYGISRLPPLFEASLNCGDRWEWSGKRLGD